MDDEPDTDPGAPIKWKNSQQTPCSTVPSASGVTKKRVPESGRIPSPAPIVSGGTFELNTSDIGLPMRNLTVLIEGVPHSWVGQGTS